LRAVHAGFVAAGFVAGLVLATGFAGTGLGARRSGATHAVNASAGTSKTIEHRRIAPLSKFGPCRPHRGYAKAAPRAKPDTI
jgi:hypothetical protein